MASEGGAKVTRRNSHDVGKYPLYTDDEEQRLQRTENLYRALLRWGGTNEEWALAAHTSVKSITRWLDNPNTMNAEAVATTCALFDVSLDYLLRGSYYLGGGTHPTLSNAPTSAERDRLEPDGIAKVYARLNEDDQRIVTELVNRLHKAQREERFVTTLQNQHRQLMQRVVQGNLTERDIDALENQMWEEEHVDEILQEQYEDNHDAIISDLRDAVESLKAQRKEQLKQLRKRPDPKVIADKLMSDA